MHKVYMGTGPQWIEMGCPACVLYPMPTDWIILPIVYYL
jgi:hypothetical protein